MDSSPLNLKRVAKNKRSNDVVSTDTNKKGAASLRIQREQGFMEYISANICILSAKRLWGLA